jgi:uncharacterized protein YceK
MKSFALFVAVLVTVSGCASEIQDPEPTQAPVIEEGKDDLQYSRFQCSQKYGDCNMHACCSGFRCVYMGSAALCL